MTKRGKDNQEAGWENRLAFLDGIEQTSEERPSLITTVNAEDALVPPIETPPRRRNRTVERFERVVKKAQLKQKRAAPPKRQVPEKVGPKGEARENVKKRVRAIQADVLKDAMPKMALQLYRDGRQIIDTFDRGADEEFYEIIYSFEAAVDAFRAVERYTDAADVLLYLVRWLITTIPDKVPTTTIKALITEARSYLDHKADRSLVKRCENLEFALLAVKTTQR